MLKSRLISFAFIVIASQLTACWIFDPGPPPPRSYVVSLSDIDGDGDEDVFAIRFNGRYRVWFNDGNAQFIQK